MATEARLEPVTWIAGTVISRNESRISAEVPGRLVHVAEVGTVVRAGGITRAAEKLHRVQSNVTTRIKRVHQGDDRFFVLATDARISVVLKQVG